MEIEKKEIRATAKRIDVSKLIAQELGGNPRRACDTENRKRVSSMAEEKKKRRVDCGAHKKPRLSLDRKKTRGHFRGQGLRPINPSEGKRGGGPGPAV